MSNNLTETLRRATCLYASFHEGFDADLARGDGRASPNEDVVRLEPDAGRTGGAIAFSARDHGWEEDELTFHARDNFPCDARCGTVSLWLRGDPDVDLADEYPVDPFHISRHPSDGSFYLDLTRPNDDRYGSPRKLRFGIYGDNPDRSRFTGGQLLVVGELGWHDRAWHHVVGTWEGMNGGEGAGVSAVYLDGVRRAWMSGYTHRVTWDLDALRIGLGQRYVGEIEDLLILNRALSGAEVEALYGTSDDLRELLQ